MGAVRNAARRFDNKIDSFNKRDLAKTLLQGDKDAARAA
jgi:hypothetical protein